MKTGPVQLEFYGFARADRSWPLHPGDDLAASIAREQQGLVAKAFGQRDGGRETVAGLWHHAIADRYDILGTNAELSLIHI